jgi:hypothetical protein
VGRDSRHGFTRLSAGLLPAPLRALVIRTHAVDSGGRRVVYVRITHGSPLSCPWMVVPDSLFLLCAEGMR